MAKFLLTIFVLFFFSSIVVISQTTKDGTYWENLSYNEKIAYATAFWNGVDWADRVLDDALKNAELDDSDYNDKTLSTFRSYSNIGSTTIGNIVSRIDDFYSDQLNKYVKLINAMDIIVLNIQGIPMDNPSIQSILSSYRQQ
jgi:hypothetical protein